MMVGPHILGSNPDHLRINLIKLKLSAFFWSLSTEELMKSRTLTSVYVVLFFVITVKLLIAHCLQHVHYDVRQRPGLAAVRVFVAVSAGFVIFIKGTEIYS